jgi:hypothetical protein
MVGGLIVLALVLMPIAYFARRNKNVYPTPNVTTLQPGETLADVKPLMNYPITIKPKNVLYVSDRR